MILLQIQLFFSSSPLLNVEIALIAVVIIFQLGLSLLLFDKIKKFKDTFLKKLTIHYAYVGKEKLAELVESGSEIKDDNVEIPAEQKIKLSLVKSESSNKIMKRIVFSLNNYLTNNYGAVVNFSIIKDIIDREVDVEDEGITQNISTPLYMGLAATMIGIILGLWAMPDLNGKEFSNGIGALIDGVKIAMIASFLGLFCTTILTSLFYKKAKHKVLEDKNNQLAYLQARLLPELVRAEDTGVSGLKASLDRFAREATIISNNVKIAAERTENTLQKQLTVISRVEGLNMNRVSKTNLELFNRLDSNMEAFDKFSKYLTLMNNISNNLLSFSNKTENIETVTKEIKTTLNESKELSRFLTGHFQQIENAGGAALKAVDLTDAHFRDAIEKLKTEVDNRIGELNSKADTAESSIRDIFDNIGTRLNKITAAHLDKLTVAYNDSIPHFEQLNNLNLLPELGDKSANQSKDLINAVNLLNTSLNSLSEKINNQPVLAKLGEIEKNLKGRTTIVKHFEEPKPKGFFKRMRNSFSRKREMSYEEE
jgi:hypothetical protein